MFFFLNSRIAKFHDFYEEHFVLQGEMKDDDRAKKHINLMKCRDLKSIKRQHLNFNFSSPKKIREILSCTHRSRAILSLIYIFFTRILVRVVLPINGDSYSLSHT